MSAKPTKSEGLTEEQVFKQPVKSVSEFATEYGDGVSNAAIDYAMDKGIIDFIKVGRTRMVVLTEKTLAYKPNPSPKRISVMDT